VPRPRRLVADQERAVAPDQLALERVISAASTFAIAMPAFAAGATTTVRKRSAAMCETPSPARPLYPPFVDGHF
jgi:hypothetical protein